MNVKTLLLAHLAKSQTGNAQQQEGDTSIQVPSTFLPILSIPDIYNFLNSTPQTNSESHSFIQTDRRLFNVDSTTQLCVVGPGLWELSFAHWNEQVGAVSDLTSKARLSFVLLDGTNPSVDVTRLVNSVTLVQYQQERLRFLISSEQALVINLNTNAGAGTGTSFSNVRILGSRLL